MGTGAFLTGVLIILLMQYVIPLLVELLVTIAPSTEGLIWFGIMIIYFLLLIGFPAMLFIRGLMASDTSDKVSSIPKAILFFIFSLAFIYATRSWPSKFVGFLDATQEGYTYFAVLFWTGYIMIIIMNTIVIPLYMITDAKKS